MQGIFIDHRRPKSKKEIREVLASDPDRVVLERTSLFGDELYGPVPRLTAGTYYFVGPDPYSDRRFYGQLIVTGTPSTYKVRVK